MRTRLFRAVCAAALASFSAESIAQMQMPGMAMPMARKPAAKRPPRAVKRTARMHKYAAHKKRAGHKKSLRVSRAGAADKTMPMDRGSMSMPMPEQPQAQAGPTPMQMNPSQMQPSHGQTSGAMSMPMSATQKSAAGNGQMSMGHGSHGMSNSGAYGPYPGQRESSGTAWQPDASAAMSGPMLMSGDWMLMVHGTVNLVYDHQSGPRGGSKPFASGMLMGMARHPLGDGSVQFRAMVSPEPITGPAGYPLLLATGETANGRTPLIDRQHPHDFFMELSTSVSQNIGTKSSVFLYGGLPGEPAFGPPAFMHRESILDSPEAPITHHWLDSTHISFGVVTAGLVLDRFKVEVSQFNAREPDQHRWNIETGPLDSTSVRVSWNPTRTLALQGSWGRFKNPEQLEPGVDQTRWSASAMWADDIAPGWHAATTLAWGRKSNQGHNDDGIAGEASIRHAGWTMIARGEWIENRELLGLVQSSAYKVGKLSLGAVRDFRIADHLSLGGGALFSLNFVPDALAPLYGRNNPEGMMGFVRLKLD